MGDIEALTTGFCPFCGRGVGPEGCPDHPDIAAARSETASTGVGATTTWQDPTPGQPESMPEAGPPPRRGPWAVLAVVVVLMALVAVVAVQAVQVHSQGKRLDALAHRLDAQARTQAATGQQVAATAAELAAANKRLATIEGRQANSLDTAAVSAKVVKSVFTVRTGSGLGSAFAFQADGSSTLLVTNFHVVADDYTAGIRTVDVLRGEETYPGTVTAVDQARDLAAIRVSLAVPPLPRATKAVRVGQPVLSVGAPLGLGQTVTNGVVSALRDGQIQFSAPISPGNSGGPVVDAAGDVVGITEAKVEAVGVEGLAFAIPIANVCKGILVC